jgi:hypothetical protein
MSQVSRAPGGIAHPATMAEIANRVRGWSHRARPVELAEVDDALVNIGDGANVISTGIQACWMFDFRARITGWFIQEFDGTTGSVVLDLGKSARGSTPSFVSIVASAPPAITTGRYSDSDLVPMTGWTLNIERGELISLAVSSVSSFKRLLIALRIRRLEP